jgi:hypothetical protein
MSSPAQFAIFGFSDLFSKRFLIAFTFLAFSEATTLRPGKFFLRMETDPQ